LVQAEGIITEAKENKASRKSDYCSGMDHLYHDRMRQEAKMGEIPQPWPCRGLTCTSQGCWHQLTPSSCKRRSPRWAGSSCLS